MCRSGKLIVQQEFIFLSVLECQDPPRDVKKRPQDYSTPETPLLKSLRTPCFKASFCKTRKKSRFNHSGNQKCRTVTFRHPGNRPVNKSMHIGLLPAGSLIFNFVQNRQESVKPHFCKTVIKVQNLTFSTLKTGLFLGRKRLFCSFSQECQECPELSFLLFSQLSAETSRIRRQEPRVSTNSETGVRRVIDFHDFYDIYESSLRSRKTSLGSELTVRTSRRVYPSYVPG